MQINQHTLRFQMVIQKWQGPTDGDICFKEQ